MQVLLARQLGRGKIRIDLQCGACGTHGWVVAALCCSSALDSHGWTVGTWNCATCEHDEELMIMTRPNLN